MFVDRKKYWIFLGILSITLSLGHFGCGEEIVPLKDNWESAIPFQKVPEGIPDITAKTCGLCHVQHYQEWKLSTHAHAWTDLQFQAELRKESSPYLCINCHIPLENQQEFIIHGLTGGDIYRPVKEVNPDFDEEFQLEGISCATCHVRDGYVIGPLGTGEAPHPVKKDPDFLNESLCISCHNASAVVTPELVCSFETGDEWRAGPFYPEKTCITCHMDTVRRPLVANYPERLSHRHWFAGSGIPKVKGVASKALEGLAYFPGTLDEEYNVGQAIEYSLAIQNKYAGHRLPSGDPERFYLINLEWEEVVSGEILADTTFRIGEKWTWYPEAKKLEDNNLEIGEKRSYSLSIIPSKPGSLQLKATITKHRMDEKTAEYNGLGDNYPRYITVFSEEKTISVLK